MTYTLGVWTVKPGREDDFVAAWTEFAGWSKQNAPGAVWVKLLRDTGNANRFVSVGPWESLDAIEAWRGMDGWVSRVQAIRPMLESFEAMTLDAVFEQD